MCDLGIQSDHSGFQQGDLGLGLFGFICELPEGIDAILKTHHKEDEYADRDNEYKNPAVLVEVFHKIILPRGCCWGNVWEAGIYLIAGYMPD